MRRASWAKGSNPTLHTKFIAGRPGWPGPAHNRDFRWFDSIPCFQSRTISHLASCRMRRTPMHTRRLEPCQDRRLRSQACCSNVFLWTGSSEAEQQAFNLCVEISKFSRFTIFPWPYRLR